MRRGDLVTVALQGDKGKPRPALVVQSDHFVELTSASLLPLTGTLRDAPLLRVEVAPNARNGLMKRSQIMVDKAQTQPRNRIDAVIGRLDDATMIAVSRALALSLGLA